MKKYIDFFPECRGCEYLRFDVEMVGYEDAMCEWWSCVARKDGNLARMCEYRKVHKAINAIGN